MPTFQLCRGYHTSGGGRHGLPGGGGGDIDRRNESGVAPSFGRGHLCAAFSPPTTAAGSQAQERSAAPGPQTDRGAARRVAREGALHSFDQAALALNEDWGTHLDGKQIQRWSEAMGQGAVVRRDAEVCAYEQGHRPASPANAPGLLVIGMDGGRVQTREKQGENGSRWREDKVSAITSYLPGDGTADHPPTPLVTTYVATMEKLVLERQNS